MELIYFFPGGQQQSQVGDKRLPVAWFELEDEVFDQYMKFLEEPTAVGNECLLVAWFEGEVLEEYMEFLEEPVAVGDERLPVAWLKGETHDECMEFLEESMTVGDDEGLPVAWHESGVLGEYTKLLEEEAAPPPRR
jgi:hypothetical protein